MKNKEPEKGVLKVYKHETTKFIYFKIKNCEYFRFSKIKTSSKEVTDFGFRKTEGETFSNLFSIYHNGEKI